MIQLSSALGASASSTVFQTTTNTKCWIRISASTAGTITIKESIDNSTFATFNSDGTDQTFTENGYKLFDLPGGVYFRLDTNGSSASVDIHIAGHGVKVLS